MRAKFMPVLVLKAFMFAFGGFFLSAPGVYESDGAIVPFRVSEIAGASRYVADVSGVESFLIERLPAPFSSFLKNLKELSYYTNQKVGKLESRLREVNFGYATEKLIDWGKTGIKLFRRAIQALKDLFIWVATPIVAFVRWSLELLR